MTRYAHHVVIGAKETGYIKRDKLETFLEARFPSHQYPGAERNRFDLKVYLNDARIVIFQTHSYIGNE